MKSKFYDKRSLKSRITETFFLILLFHYIAFLHAPVRCRHIKLPTTDYIYIF